MALTRERYGLSRWECIDELQSLFDDKVPSYGTVKNRFNKINCVRLSLKDEVCEGRPKTDVVSENIDAVGELVMQDCHVT